MAICSFLCIPLLHIPVFYAFYVEYSTHNSEKVVFSAILRYGHIFNPVITSKDDNIYLSLLSLLGHSLSVDPVGKNPTKIVLFKCIFPKLDFF